MNSKLPESCQIGASKQPSGEIRPCLRTGSGRGLGLERSGGFEILPPGAEISGVMDLG